LLFPGDLPIASLIVPLAFKRRRGEGRGIRGGGGTTNLSPQRFSFRHGEATPGPEEREEERGGEGRKKKI